MRLYAGFWLDCTGVPAIAFSQTDEEPFFSKNFHWTEHQLHFPHTSTSDCHFQFAFCKQFSLKILKYRNFWNTGNPNRGSGEDDRMIFCSWKTNEHLIRIVWSVVQDRIWRIILLLRRCYCNFEVQRELWSRPLFHGELHECSESFLMDVLAAAFSFLHVRMWFRSGLSWSILQIRHHLPG